jgi:hypothetical protein
LLFRTGTGISILKNWTQNWKLESSNKYFLELEQEVLHKSKEPHNNAILYLCVFISMVVVTIDKYLKLFLNEIQIPNYIFKMHCLFYKNFQIFVGMRNIFPKFCINYSSRVINKKIADFENFLIYELNVFFKILKEEFFL